jgi:hypothetical protein
MAIYRMTQSSCLGPAELARVTKAYEDTLRALGLVDRADPLTEIIAKRIIETAQTGELDSERICEHVIAGLGKSRKVS